MRKWCLCQWCNLVFASFSSACGQTDWTSSWDGRWAASPCTASWRSSSLWKSSSASWTWKTCPSQTAPRSSPNHRATSTSATTSARLSSRDAPTRQPETSTRGCVNMCGWEGWTVLLCTYILKTYSGAGDPTLLSLDSGNDRWSVITAVSQALHSWFLCSRVLASAQEPSKPRYFVFYGVIIL